MPAIEKLIPCVSLHVLRTSSLILIQGLFRTYSLPGYADYVKPKKNEIRATVNFSRCRQEPNERFDYFVSALCILVKDCGYSIMEGYICPTIEIPDGDGEVY